MIRRSALALAVMLLSLFSARAYAQNEPVVIKASDGTSVFNVWDAANGGIKFSCVFGCSGGGGSSATIADGGTFTAGTTNTDLFSGIFDDALGAVTSGKAAGVRITNKRAIHVNFRAADGTEIGTAAAPIRTDPTGTTTQPVNLTTGLPPGSNSIGSISDVTSILNPLSIGTADSSTLFTGTGQTLPIGVGNAQGAIAWWAGTYTAAGTLTFQASTDNGATYFAVPATRVDTSGNATEVLAIPVGTEAPTVAWYYVQVGGFTHLKLTSAGTWTTANVTVHVSKTQALVPREFVSVRNLPTTQAVKYSTATATTATLDLTVSNAAHTVSNLAGMSAVTWRLAVSIDVSGSPQVAVEATLDGTNWIDTYWTLLAGSAAGTGVTSVGPVTFSIFETDVIVTPIPAGATAVRLRVSSTGGGSVGVTATPSASPVVPGVFATIANGLVSQGAANTLSNGWPVKVTDGTTTAGVKAASTAAVAADPAVVVSLSPNSPPPLGTSDSTHLFTATADTFVVNVTNAESVVVWWTGTYTAAGTLAFSTSADGGVTYVSVDGVSVDTGGVENLALSVGVGTESAATKRYYVPLGHATHFKLTSTGTWTTASVTAHVTKSGIPRPYQINKVDQGSATTNTANGWAVKITNAFNIAAVTAASTAVAASDSAVAVGLHPSSPLPAGTNLIGAINQTQINGTALSANTGAADAGTQRVAIATQTLAVNQTQINGVAVSVDRGVSDTGTQRAILAQEATYSAGTTIKTATAAGTAPFFNICGSGTKTIRVQRVSVSGTVATAAVWGDLVVKKTSTAATGGTATTLTNTPYDSNNAAATATAKYFTVLPTAGTSVGVVFTATQLFPVTAISATLQPTPAPIVYMWRDQDAEAPTLRGTAQCLEMNFGTTTTNAPTLSVSVAWTEK